MNKINCWNKLLSWLFPWRIIWHCLASYHRSWMISVSIIANSWWLPWGEWIYVYGRRFTESSQQKISCYYFEVNSISSSVAICLPVLATFHWSGLDNTFGEHLRSEYATKAPMLSCVAFWSLFFWNLCYRWIRHVPLLYFNKTFQSKYHHLPWWSSYISSIMYK